MALASLQTGVKGRGAAAGGKTSVACSAYISGQELYDEYRGLLERGDKKREQRVTYTAMMLPDGAPEWMADREKLWLAMERSEDAFNQRSATAMVSRENRISLLCEWSPDQMIQAIRRFAQDQYVSRGLVAELAIHAPEVEKGADPRNWHCHMHVTTRAVDKEGDFGFSQKKAHEPGWNRESLFELRHAWQVHVNRLNEEWGIRDANGQILRISMESHAARGTGLIPEPKLGPVAMRMEREGRESHAGNDVRAVRAENDNRRRNAELAAIRAEQAESVANVTDLADRGTKKVDQQPGQFDTPEMRRAQELEMKAQGALAIGKTHEELQANIKALAEKAAQPTPEQLFREQHAKIVLEQTEQAKHRQKQNDEAIQREQANNLIVDPHLRYSEALGKTGATIDPYVIMAQAARAEASKTAEQHAALMAAVGKAETEQDRAIAMMRVQIHVADYQWIVSQREVKIADSIAGHKGSESGDMYQARTAMWEEERKQLREQHAEAARAIKENNWESFHEALKMQRAEQDTAKQDKMAAAGYQVSNDEVQTAAAEAAKTRAAERQHEAAGAALAAQHQPDTSKGAEQPKTADQVNVQRDEQDRSDKQQSNIAAGNADSAPRASSSPGKSAEGEAIAAKTEKTKEAESKGIEVADDGVVKGNDGGQRRSGGNSR